MTHDQPVFFIQTLLREIPTKFTNICKVPVSVNTA